MAKKKTPAAKSKANKVDATAAPAAANIEAADATPSQASGEVKVKGSVLKEALSVRVGPEPQAAGHTIHVGS